MDSSVMASCVCNIFILTLDFTTQSLNESSPCPRGLEYSSKDQQLELYNFSRHVTLLMRNPFIFCPVFSFLFFFICLPPETS